MFGLGEPEIPAGGPATGSGGLAGVWAESNTREAIYDALRRKETYATSGTRLNIRFFGGWDYAIDGLPDRPDWVRAAYAAGVPMGGDLPARPGDSGAPRFILQAVKDPDGANLDRAQIVKVWRDERLPGSDIRRRPVGRTHRGSGNRRGAGRRQHRRAHESPPTRTASGQRGSTAVWEDPAFDPAVTGCLLPARAESQPRAGRCSSRSSWWRPPLRRPADHPGARLVVGHLVRAAGARLISAAPPPGRGSRSGCSGVHSSPRDTRTRRACPPPHAWVSRRSTDRSTPRDW